MCAMSPKPSIFLTHGHFFSWMIFFVKKLVLYKSYSLTLFLATLVALHFTPVSKWVSESAEFRTSVASRLASLFLS